MPINADYEYFEAEKKYLDAQTNDEKIAALEELIRKAPKHKGTENLLSGLKTRLKKLREKGDRVRKMGGGKKGIKKEGFQVVMMGLPNSGKSSLLRVLTNARPAVSEYPFTTQEPELGTMEYERVQMQLIDLPSVGSDAFDIGIVNTADCILLVLDSTRADVLEQVATLQSMLFRINTKHVFIVFSRIDLLSDNELRKLQERCKSKRLQYMLFASAVSRSGLDTLRRSVFESMDVIRAFTKEPGKSPSPLPIVLPIGSTVKDVAESIYKGFSLHVRETRLTGPSGKFANQKVGLGHILKDKDILEFHIT